MSGSGADADPQPNFGDTTAVQKVITNNSVTIDCHITEEKKYKNKNQQSESKYLL